MHAQCCAFPVCASGPCPGTPAHPLTAQLHRHQKRRHKHTVLHAQADPSSPASSVPRTQYVPQGFAPPWSRSWLGPVNPPAPAPPPGIEELGPVDDAKLKDWAVCTSSLYTEYDYYISKDLVEGSWPRELIGTFLSNSPGLPFVHGHHVRNLADADGMISSIAIGDDGQVFFRNRFVRTPCFESEQLAGRRLHRGFFDKGLLSGDGSPLTSWLLNPMDLRFPSRANAGVLSWGGKLYALSQHDLPFELNKQVLDTIGASTLPGGVLQGNAAQLSGRCKVMPAGSGQGQRLVLMSVAQSMMDIGTLCALLTFTELDESGKKVAQVQHRIPNALASTITDFHVTENWYAVLVPPVSFNAQRFATSYMLGDVGFAECLDFDATKPSKIHLVPRGQSQQAPGPQVHEELKKSSPRDAGPPNISGPAAMATQGSCSSSVALREQGAVQGSQSKPKASQGNTRRGPIVLDGPPLIVSSTINSYECDDGRVMVLDAVYERDLGFWKDASQLMPGYFSAGAKPEVMRMVIDVAQPSLLNTRVLSHRSTSAAVASSQQGQPHQWVFTASSAVESAASGGPPQAICKLSVPPAESMVPLEDGRPQRQSCSPCEVWYPGDRCFPGPLLLHPKAQNGGNGAEDDTWLLCLIHDADAQKAELVVLDAAQITAGPVARIRLPHHVPYASAVTWTREIYGPGRVLQNVRARGQLKR